MISMSFGAEEAQVTPGAAEAMCRYAIQLTSRGTTIIVSSGDTGVGGLVDPKTKQPPPCPPFRSVVVDELMGIWQRLTVFYAAHLAGRRTLRGANTSCLWARPSP